MWYVAMYSFLGHIKKKENMQYDNYNDNMNVIIDSQCFLKNVRFSLLNYLDFVHITNFMYSYYICDNVSLLTNWGGIFNQKCLLYQFCTEI